MNAISFAPPVAQTLQEAIAAANLWTATARPIAKAMFALQDAQSDLVTARFTARGEKRWNEPQAWDEYALKSASDEIDKPINELFGHIEGIRDSVMCDNYRSLSFDASDEECDVVGVFNDDLDRSVLSVDAFVKQMGDEA
ncbi:hypothetical protein GCM10008023_05620 [Sphingomonas glacialis]|uniref:Uncharacterized protein n=1 Tax=Sphingomonas glacialis TaxID=658225 RepID=A0ABQ3L9W8_9SPHN|nr:hypothetical protein [Sphingomonas glacialis]GHH09230.1 hypothetical protein GCM10008023_05620 [Sphingomonas glacialis]